MRQGQGGGGGRLGGAGGPHDHAWVKTGCSCVVKERAATASAILSVHPVPALRCGGHHEPNESWTGRAPVSAGVSRSTPTAPSRFVTVLRAVSAHTWWGVRGMRRATVRTKMFCPFFFAVFVLLHERSARRAGAATTTLRRNLTRPSYPFAVCVPPPGRLPITALNRCHPLPHRDMYSRLQRNGQRRTECVDRTELGGDTKQS